MQISEIFDLAADALDGAMPGTVKALEIEYDELGAYDRVNQRTIRARRSVSGGRGIFDTTKAIRSRFPEYQFGPNDRMMWIGGISQTPEIGWRIKADGVERTVQAVGDLMEAGGMFAVVLN